MSKGTSSKNHEVQLAAFLIGRLAAEGVCIGAHKALIFDAAIEASNELIRHQPEEAEMEERYALIAEQILEELRRRIDLTTKPGGPNIVSPNLGPQHLEELQNAAAPVEIGAADAMTIANMRSLGVTAIEAMCECGRQMVVDVTGLPGSIKVPALRHRLRCVECGGRPNDVRPNWREHERRMGGGAWDEL